MQDLAPTLEQLSTAQTPAIQQIIIPAIALAEAAYLGEKERIETKTDLIFGIVENALNHRVYPLDVTIVKKSMELQKTVRASRQVECSDSKTSWLRTHHKV